MKSLDKERRKLEKAGFTGQTLERAMNCWSGRMRPFWPSSWSRW